MGTVQHCELQLPYVQETPLSDLIRNSRTSGDLFREGSGTATGKISVRHN
jgi:hypothetical protein